MSASQMTKRWFLACLIAGSCMATSAFAAQSGKDMTIWFDAGGPVGESYVTVVQNGAKQAAEDLGVDLRLQYSDWQPEKMIENFKQAVAAKPTGIVVVGLPGDTAYKPLVDEAIGKGILVTSFDTELPMTLEADQSKGFGYVGDNNAVRGIRLAKEALRRSGLKAGEHALVWGLKDRAARSESTFGLIKGLEQAGIKVDFLQISPEVDKDPSLGAPVFTSYIASHPDVKMVLVDHGALTAQMGNLMRNASVKPGELYVAGFSLSPATAEGIKSGYVQLVADAQPYLMGYLSVVQIVLSKRYGFSGLDINTGAGFVSKENIGLISPLASKGLR